VYKQSQNKELAKSRRSKLQLKWGERRERERKRKTTIHNDTVVCVWSWLDYYS
jgi:hypothetical protein